MISDEPMLPLFNRLKAWWTTAEKNQRITILGGIGALLLVLVGTAFFATRTHYATLMEGLSDLDRGQAIEALKGMGIAAQSPRAGVVEVPEGKVEEARMGLATAGKLPKGAGHLSFADLKTMGPMASPEVESQTVKAILEGEIARTLETMEGVSTASVILAMPKPSAFAQEQKHATASVTLTENGRGMLTKENGRVIANLVCGSVDGMRPEDVFVSSSALGVLWDGQRADSGDSKSDLDAKTSRDWESRVQAALDATLGPGNTKVLARADVDTRRKSLRKHDETPNERPTSVTSEKEAMDGATKTLPTGFAGATSNTPPGAKAPAEAPTDAVKGAKYDKSAKKADYGTNTLDEVTEGGIGDLKGLAITVVANSDKISDPAPVQKIVDGVMGGLIQRDAANLPVANQPFSATVTSLPFDGAAAKAAKEAADAAAGQQRMQQIVSILPIAAILLVALLVARQVGKISKAVLPAPAVATGELAEGSPEELALAAGGAEYDPEAPALTMDAGEPEESPLALESIKDRVDIPLETLKKMAAERPEMVATLIKSMLLGDRA